MHPPCKCGHDFAHHYESDSGRQQFGCNAAMFAGAQRCRCSRYEPMPLQSDLDKMCGACSHRAGDHSAQGHCAGDGVGRTRCPCALYQPLRQEPELDTPYCVCGHSAGHHSSVMSRRCAASAGTSEVCPCVRFTPGSLAVVAVPSVAVALPFGGEGVGVPIVIDHRAAVDTGTDNLANLSSAAAGRTIAKKWISDASIRAQYSFEDYMEQHHWIVESVDSTSTHLGKAQQRVHAIMPNNSKISFSVDA